MGLGKTVQIICVLLAVYHKTGTNYDLQRQRDLRKTVAIAPEEITLQSPSLIVVPATVIGNWIEEISQWGHFSVLSSSKQQKGNTFTITKSANIGKEVEDFLVEVLVVSYEFMRETIDQLKCIRWNMIIFDEGHKMKNATGRLQFAAKMLNHARSRIILTGTPIQNRIEELGSLLGIVTRNVGFTRSKEFKEHFVGPIKRSLKKNADEEAVTLGAQRNRELQGLLSRYILRRTKGEVLPQLRELGKEEIIVYCKLSKIQSDMYSHILSLPDFDNVRFFNRKCPCGSGIQRSDCCPKYIKPYIRESNNREVDISAAIWRAMHHNDAVCEKCPTCVCLPCIQVLMKLANHPSLLQVSCDDSQIVQSTARCFLRNSLTQDFIKSIGGENFNPTDMTTFENSGKFVVLKGLLRQFHRLGEKTLVFSHSLRVLDLIEYFVSMKGYEYVRLDGNINVTSRQNLVHDFNRRSSITFFLISTKAGGTGLNLQTASNVIIFDCSWNPSWDMQAQDRAYRYGQKKPVKVYRLISEGTVEEIIYMRQLYKQSLQESILTKKANHSTSMSSLRKFTGIEGDSSCRGELFGTENILQFQDGSILASLRDQYAAEDVRSMGDATKSCHEGVDRESYEKSGRTDVEVGTVNYKPKLPSPIMRKHSLTVSTPSSELEGSKGGAVAGKCIGGRIKTPNNLPKNEKTAPVTAITPLSLYKPTYLLQR